MDRSLRYATGNTRWADSSSVWGLRCVATVAVVAALLLAGCESTPEADLAEPTAENQPVDAQSDGKILDGDGRPLPKLGEIASRLEESRPGPQPRAERDSALERSVVRVEPATLSIFRIDLPLDTPTDEAWTLVNPTTISKAVRASWHLNGIRVGTLNQAEVGQFIVALRDVVGSRKQHLRLGSIPSALQTSPGLVRPVRVDLTVPPFAVKQQAVMEGHLRLLASVSRDELDRVWLDILPQHHVRENVLLPRNPLEPQFDGELFHELKLRGPAWPGTVLVIGLGPDPALPDQPEPQTADEAQNPERGVRALEAALDPAFRTDPTQRRDMGAMLFGASRFNKPIQKFLLITSIQTR